MPGVLLPFRNHARVFCGASEGAVLVLDDVFAELDTLRRERLAAAIADADQVIVTAAVESDVPPGFIQQSWTVSKDSDAPVSHIEAHDPLIDLTADAVMTSDSA